MDWGALVPTLVGGAISLVSSVAVFTLAERAERKKKEKNRREEQAADAFVGLQKLMYSLNAIENLARHIETEFRSAEGDGGANMEPAAIVRTIVGSDSRIEDLQTKEFAFLIDETGELAAKIAEIQERCKNSMAAVQTFNELKADYDRFVEENAEFEEIEGNLATMVFKDRDAKVAELKVGRMNQLLASIIASLEEDRKQVREVTSEFIKKAVESFGDEFPARSLEMRVP